MGNKARLNIGNLTETGVRVFGIVAKEGTKNGGLDEDYAENLDVTDNLLAIV